MTKERTKYALFVNGSEDCYMVSEILRKMGVRFSILDTREISFTSDRPLVLPLLATPMGQFQGTREIENFFNSRR